MTKILEQRNQQLDQDVFDKFGADLQDDQPWQVVGNQDNQIEDDFSVDRLVEAFKIYKQE